jgi:hypothetical protein
MLIQKRYNFFKKTEKPDVVSQPYNTCTQEAEAEG